MELPQIYENMLIEYCSGNLINESFIGDYIENTDEFDMELVEEIKLDEYTLFLAKDEGNNYWLGLTSGERLCFNPEQQNRKYPCLADHIKIGVAKQLLVVLKTWTKKYGYILVGSFDVKKLKSYYKILKFAKFDVTTFRNGPFEWYMIR
jgi:hypothetical protein